MAQKKVSRRERERIRHRKEILESACEVFAEKGFRRSTIQDIAERSEFSVASIYRHFESKEDIYHSLIEDVLEEYFSRLKRKTSSIESPTQRLIKALDATFDMVIEKEAFLKFLFTDFRINLETDTDKASEKSALVYWKLINFFVATFEEGIKKKEILDQPALSLTIALLGNLYSFLNYCLMFSGNLEEMKAKHRDSIIKIFFGPVALKPIPEESL